VGGEGREELVVWLVKFAWIRTCKGRTTRSAKCKPKGKKMANMGNSVLNALLALEDGVSACVSYLLVSIY